MINRTYIDEKHNLLWDTNMKWFLYLKIMGMKKVTVEARVGSICSPERFFRSEQRSAGARCKIFMFFFAVNYRIVLHFILKTNTKWLPCPMKKRAQNLLKKSNVEIHILLHLPRLTCDINTRIHTTFCIDFDNDCNNDNIYKHALLQPKQTVNIAWYHKPAVVIETIPQSLRPDKEIRGAGFATTNQCRTP